MVEEFDAAKREALKRVETQEQAERMTQEDQFGTVWRVGDEYYEIPVCPGWRQIP